MVDVWGIEAPARAVVGSLTVVLRISALEQARAARQRGALVVVDQALAGRFEGDWVHPNPSWVMAQILERCDPTLPPPRVGEGSYVHPTALLYPGVVLGARVRVEPYAVLGGPGFGWATGPDAQSRAMPHLGGLEIGDDVFVGAHSTIHAGVLTATRIGSRTKIDAQVHVGHNCEVGEDCFFAAQTGLAGSVIVGRHVLLGGQVGVADHVTIGDGARIAAKSGVIGDVPKGATFAGYPARNRVRWLRSIAALESLGRARS